MYTHCPPKELPELVSETFPDGRRYYVTPGGQKLPSVTTVIGAMGKKAIMEWKNRVGEEAANKISSKASRRGTKVHALFESYVRNESIDWSGLMPDSVALFRSLTPYLKKINNIHYVEQALWSEQLGMAGRCDLIAEWDGKLSVIDLKTSSKPKEERNIANYFAQCVAYSLMYEERVGVPIDQFVILMAVEEDYPQVFVKNTQDYVQTLAEHIDFYHKNVLTSK